MVHRAGARAEPSWARSAAPRPSPPSHQVRTRRSPPSATAEARAVNSGEEGPWARGRPHV
eukprot:4121423-Pleurochrysis_carterae.AAC.1